MRKGVYGRQFKRDKDERKALFKGLLSSLVLNGRIKTTEQKAKAIKPDADKMITKARKEAILAKRLLERDLIPGAIDKLMHEIAPRFRNRNGGYTRIIKLGNRFSDNASTAILEWVEGEEVIVSTKETKKEVKSKVVSKKTSKTKPAVKKPTRKVSARASLAKDGESRRGGKNVSTKK